MYVVVIMKNGDKSHRFVLKKCYLIIWLSDS